MRPIHTLFILLAIAGCKPDTNTNQAAPQESRPDPSTAAIRALDEMLEGWSAAFVKKIDSSYAAGINFTLTNAPDSYHVRFSNKGYEIISGVVDSAHFGFDATLEQFNKIYRGDMTAMTSMGKATSSDPTPLVPEINRAVSNHLLNDFFFFSQRFFNRSPYDKVLLGLEHSRVVHGGHAIPIFYQRTDEIGVRSAWYQINQGEQVNEPGDTNPFPQYFIIQQGKGFAKIGSDTLAVKANEAYFVPPGHDHVFWNASEEPLIFIFLAWGQGA